MSSLTGLTSTRALRALLLVTSFAALAALSAACGPARSGGGSDSCESDDDCKSTEYCKFEDPGDDEGECKRRATSSNNNPANNSTPVPAQCDALCEKYVECGIFTEEQQQECLDSCEGQSIPASFQECLLSSACEDLLNCEEPANNAVNNSPVNNNPVNNNPVNNNPVNNNPVNNNPVNNNPVDFTEGECRLTCDRFLTCEEFAECPTSVRNEGRNSCYNLCAFEEQRTFVEQLRDASCGTVADAVSGLIDTSSCGPEEDTCVSSCEYLLSCTEPVCPGAIVPLDQCLEICRGDDAARTELEGLANQSCGQLREAYCPVDGDTNAGAACAATNDCFASTEALCIQDSPEWPGGYCTASCRSDSECGGNNVCLQFSDGNFCVQGCTSSLNCREEYSCWPLAENVSTCLPRCTSNADCGQGFTCNIAEGYCE